MKKRLRYLYLLAAAALLAACATSPKSPPEQPNKTLYVSPETSDVELSEYQAEFRKRIAHGGEANFPRVNGAPVYGSALMAVTIGHTGYVEALDVIDSSSDEVAGHAEQLVRDLQPYRSFAPELRARAARVVLMARIKYDK